MCIVYTVVLCTGPRISAAVVKLRTREAKLDVYIIVLTEMTLM